MRRLALCALAAFLSVGIATTGFAQTRPRITLQQMEDMFQNIRAKTKWNVDGDLLWGYFFMDPQPEKLRPLAAELAGSGYRVVNMYPSRDGRVHVLHVERVETHSPQSLQDRNTQFYALAEKYGVASYDGMDVGPAGQAK